MPPLDVSAVVFMKDGPSFRRWLEKNHTTADELWVGYYKRESGIASITWPESVDEALCFGWIDGVRKSLDDQRYVIRFTPRRAGSIWSSKNIKRVEELKGEGRMRAEGLAAYEQRKENRSGVYSFEQRPEALAPEQERIFRRNKVAWRYFEEETPSYRRAAIWWVISAKQEPTRLRRLEQLIAFSERGEAVPQFRRPEKKSRS